MSVMPLTLGRAGWPKVGRISDRLLIRGERLVARRRAPSRHGIDSIGVDSAAVRSDGLFPDERRFMHLHSSPAPDRGFLRIGVVSGVLGVVLAVVQSAIDPAYSDDPVKAIGQASLSHFLTLSRVLDMTAFLLLLVAVSVVTAAFPPGRGARWARVARTVYAVSATAGAIATMLVGSLPDVASSWADASPALQPGYVAAYDALGHVSGGIFSVSWTALGLFGIMFAVALRRSEEFSNVLAGISATSGVALVGAVVIGVGLQVPIAFVLLILGLLLSYAVVVASGVRAWRLAGADEGRLALTEPVS
jgi:hypothetical protein